VSKKSDRPKKPLRDRAREIVEEVLSTLEDLLLPQPELIPIPADRPQPRRR
jgi:hypothetical protein